MGEDTSGKQQQDRRTGNDRRQFTFTLHIPERRKGDDRRKSEDKEKESNTTLPKNAPEDGDS